MRQLSKEEGEAYPTCFLAVEAVAAAMVGVNAKARENTESQALVHCFNLLKHHLFV